jgi:hypothetical protein
MKVRVVHDGGYWEMSLGMGLIVVGMIVVFGILLVIGMIATEPRTPYESEGYRRIVKRK